MKKRFISILIVCLAAVMAVGCGYNSIMREHLGNKDNYDEYTGVWREIKTIKDGDAVELLMEWAGEYNGNSGSFSNYSEEYGANVSRVQVMTVNNDVLTENGFYENVAIGDKITIKCSSWIYMDGRFNYVIAVSANGVTYLDEETGLKNLVDYMNANKGL